MIRAAVATPLRCATVAVLILGVTALGRWCSGGREWGHFAVVGSELADPANLPLSVPIVPGRGYDGQFFLRLSLDPWPGAAADHGIMLDDAAYRHQRIALPALAWLLSAGRPTRAPATLVLVNLLALSLAVGACAALARELGRPPALGLGLLGISGLILAFGRDLAEPLVILFLSVAALALARGRAVTMSLALTGAVLAREDALLAVVALAVAAALERKERPSGTTAALLPALVLPVAVLATWQAALWSHWGRLPVLAGADRLTLPFAGLFGAWLGMADTTPGEVAAHALYLLWHVVLAVEVGRSLVGRSGVGEGRSRLLERWAAVAWLAWLVLALFLATPVWGDEWAFARVLAQWSFFGLVLFLVGEWRPSRSLLGLTLLLGAASVGRLFLRP